MEWVNIQHKIFAYLLTNWFCFLQKAFLDFSFCLQSYNCVKSVQILSFFLVPIFLQSDWIRIQSEYRKIPTRKNSVFRQFLRSIYSNQSSNCDNSVDLVREICGHEMIAWILSIVLFSRSFFLSFCNIYKVIWDKVFKSGLSKFCGRQHLKNVQGYDLFKKTISLEIFKDCCPQNLISPLLNILSHL